MKTPISVHNLLRGDQSINRLLSTIKRQQELLSQVRSALPEPLRAHCLHLVVKEEEILIYTDASVWAHRMTFASRKIKNLLPDTQRVTRVRLKVLPLLATPKSKTRLQRPQPVSEVNQRLIQQLADGISDNDLSAALKRLAKRVATKPTTSG